MKYEEKLWSSKARFKITTIIPYWSFVGDGMRKVEYDYDKIARYILNNRYNPRLLVRNLQQHLLGTEFFLQTGRSMDLSDGYDHYFDMTELIEKSDGDMHRYSQLVFQRDSMEILLPGTLYFLKESPIKLKVAS